MRSRTVAILAVVCGLLTLPAAVRADTGPYLDYASQPSFAPGTSTMGSTFIGPDGVPQVNYAWGVEDNPVTVCQWALQHWSWWTESHWQTDLDAVTTASDWLVARMQPDGSVPYLFDFDALGVHEHAPWISAMAQGQTISVLVRAHDATGDRRYMDAAVLALEPFEKTSARGGAASTWDGLPWYEEYPGVGEEHVLNGFEFSLLGLHDLAPFSPDAQRLFEQGVASLEQRVGTFDARASRAQWYAALGGGRFVVPPVYRHVHAVLTGYLAALTGDPTLTTYAGAWQAYLAPASPAPAPAPQPRPQPRPAPTATPAAAGT